MKNPAILAISSTTRSALLALASSVLLSGCYSTGGHIPDKARFPESVPTGMLDFVKPDKAAASKGELPVAQRMATTDGGASRLYSFKAMGQSLRVSIDQFAKANKLNVIFDQDVSGIVNVEFRDLTLDQAMDAILDPIGLGWVQEDGTIRIVREVTNTYQVDYLRAARSGNASVSSTTNGVGGGNSTGTITNADSINFWNELDTEIKSLLTKANAEVDQDAQQPTETSTTTGMNGMVTVTSHPIQQVEGRVTINKISGTVQVSTSPRRMKAIDAYMKNMMQGINRQVYIEARILDVKLQDDASLGIDWTKVAFGKNQNLTFSTLSATGSGGNIITAAAGGAAALPGTTFFNYTKNFPASFLVSNITAAIQALEEQGTVRVLSQPRVRALNNQAAIMKVGTDRTFYTLTTTITTPTAGAPIQTVSENATKVTEGVVLSVTPQISADGYITLDVMPAVNKIVGIDKSPSGNSNAPQVETKQTSTMVRLKDGETAVIGGLIMEEDSETGRQVPGVGDVPGLGWLFKGKYSNKVRSELVIFITPHLIEN